MDGKRPSWVPYELIIDRVRELAAEFEIVELRFDPAMLGYAVEVIEGLGVNMVPVNQGHSVMIKVSSNLYTAVVERGVRHDGDQILASHVGAAVARDVDGRAWRLGKAHGADEGRQLSDATFALAFAIDGARANLPATAGTYEIRRG